MVATTIEIERTYVGRPAPLGDPRLGVVSGIAKAPVAPASVIGLSVQALVSLEIDQRKMPTIIEGLRALPEVLEVRIQAGREDLLVHVAIASLEELQRLTAAFVRLEGVRKTTSTFTVSTPIPYRILPLLNELTKHAGWGRSTPAPQQD